MAEHGISQTKVAEALDRSQGHVWGRVSGAYALSLDVVECVARLAGEDPAGLLARLLTRPHP